MSDPTIKPFSSQLEQWLTSGRPKTIHELNRVFAEKSLAIIILVLMFLPALPLPTGGVSHVFEIVAMLLALQLMIGMREIWIPKRWANRNVAGLNQPKIIRAMAKSVRWLERFSRPRFAGILKSRPGLLVAGLLLFVYSLAAFVAPPFSGLDTFPSAGAVILALSLILDDIALACLGAIVGAVGTGVIIGTGAVFFNFVHHLFT